MRKVLIIANWKMNKLIDESLTFAKQLVKSAKGVNEREIVICPSFTLLASLRDAVKNSNIKLGAQDMFYEQSGAFTGEISPLMLKELGCEYVLIGHSERRSYFNESNEDVNKKIKSALANGIKPIMCIGERLEQRRKDETFDVIEDQLLIGLSGIPKEALKKVVIAYEPVWAIGTGVNATPSQAEEVHTFIRRLFEENFSGIADSIRILYGGSVTPNNSKELLSQRNVDGLLVGGASLDVKKFIEIVKN